jgi:hypothetical protein
LRHIDYLTTVSGGYAGASLSAEVLQPATSLQWEVSRIRQAAKLVRGVARAIRAAERKPTMTGDEDADLIRYWAENREFPHDSTMDQSYTPGKFESYRQLGAHSGMELIRALMAVPPNVLASVLGKTGQRLIAAWAGTFHDSSKTELSRDRVSAPVHKSRPRMARS